MSRQLRPRLEEAASRRVAVAALERAQQDEPDKIYDDLAEAVRCLLQFRNELITEQRAGERRDRLDRCNAILSMVVASEHPLVGVRRERVQKARDELGVAV